MGGASSTHGRGEKVHTKIQSKNLQGRNTSETYADMGDNIKMDLKVWKFALDSSGP